MTLRQQVSFRQNDRTIVALDGTILVDGMYWINGDDGAWDGPVSDWVNWHSPNIDKYVKQRRVAIQAGGNLGMYPKLLSKSFDNVYTFEPDQLNFYCLNLNCPEENIFKINAALGHAAFMIDLFRPTMTNVGMHMVDQTRAEYGSIPMMTLDNTFEFQAVDLLMLDLEGFELNALYGATNLLTHHKPVVFVERPNQEVKDLLTNLGYKFAETSAMDEIWIP